MQRIYFMHVSIINGPCIMIFYFTIYINVRFCKCSHMVIFSKPKIKTAINWTWFGYIFNPYLTCFLWSLLQTWVAILVQIEKWDNCTISNKNLDAYVACLTISFFNVLFVLLNQCQERCLLFSDYVYCWCNCTYMERFTMHEMVEHCKWSQCSLFYFFI